MKIKLIMKVTVQTENDYFTSSVNTVAFSLVEKMEAETGGVIVTVQTDPVAIWAGYVAVQSKLPPVMPLNVTGDIAIVIVSPVAMLETFKAIEASEVLKLAMLLSPALNLRTASKYLTIINKLIENDSHLYSHRQRNCLIIQVLCCSCVHLWSR